ncbi:ABC transporter ATP-binding protein [Pseudonocardia sp. DSM 110487]|uniref:ABC transporter ATP-binding protein n=1 Tax=Pseudonocardia sp. DSM 110487 TaxID=2865833 RepID=UPI001C69DA74|nr:ABC transporter ATP-binding protein [Pseudonocardia sp. DSM 110487]QYN39009.1 ABC transporter ATP-binding protein [Pseudonocardia sp. DSM 110487]
MIVLDGVTKKFGDHLALDVPSLTIPPRSFAVVVGPSGCGKSTALRIISGLERPTSGRVLIDGTDATERQPGERNLAMVFQDFALYPHMTVADNIGFSLRLQARHDRRGGPSRQEITRRVGEAAVLLRIDKLLGRRPAQLSGGERQRVAIARAIVRRPAVLLLDEPLSSLDAQLRHHARAELVRLHRELDTTVVLVTHDQGEALSMASHLVVLDAGRVAQAGPPGDVYHRPRTVGVATFLGSPAMNLHDVDLTADGTASRVCGPGLRGRLPAPPPGVRVRLGWRPADALIDRSGPSRDGVAVEGVVDVVEFTGEGHLLNCTGPDGAWTASLPGSEHPPATGSQVLAFLRPERVHLFDAATGVRLANRWDEPT